MKNPNALAQNKNLYSVICQKEKNSNVLYSILFEYFPEEKNMTIKINKINDGDTKKNKSYIFSAFIFRRME